MDKVEVIRQKIRDKGYMSAMEVVVSVAKSYPGTDRNELDDILDSLICEDISKLEYTTAQVSEYRVKDLFYHIKKG